MIGYKVKHKNPTIHGLINARPVRRHRLSAFDLLLVFFLFMSLSYLRVTSHASNLLYSNTVLHPSIVLTSSVLPLVQYYPLIPENEIPSIKYF